MPNFDGTNDLILIFVTGPYLGIADDLEAEIAESRISCAVKRLCVESSDEVLREVLLLRLRHGASETVLDKTVAILQRSLDFIQAQLCVDVPNFRSHKRSFDQFSTALQQAASSYQRQSFVERVFKPVVRCVDMSLNLCSISVRIPLKLHVMHRDLL